MDWRVVLRTILTAIVFISCMEVWNHRDWIPVESEMQHDWVIICISIICLSFISLLFNYFVKFKGNPAYLLHGLSALLLTYGLSIDAGSMFNILCIVGLLSLAFLYSERILLVRDAEVNARKE